MQLHYRVDKPFRPLPQAEATTHEARRDLPVVPLACGQYLLVETKENQTTMASVVADTQALPELGPERSITMSIRGWQLCYSTDKDVGIALSLSGHFRLDSNEWQEFVDFHLCKSTASDFHGTPRARLPQTAIGFLHLEAEPGLAKPHGQIVVSQDDPLAIFNLLHAGHRLELHVLGDHAKNGVIAIKQMIFYIVGGRQ